METAAKRTCQEQHTQGLLTAESSIYAHIQFNLESFIRKWTDILVFLSACVDFQVSLFLFNSKMVLLSTTAHMLYTKNIFLKQQNCCFISKKRQAMTNRTPRCENNNNAVNLSHRLLFPTPFVRQIG